jgi:HD-GYP domain-containing protein (c-di-GMP phosphodiesterase class II)
MSMVDPKKNVLTVACAPEVKESFISFLEGANVLDYSAYEDFENLIEDPPEKDFHLILAGAAIEGLSPIELAQSLKMQYPSAPFFFITHQRDGFDRKVYVKNGFTDAYLLPIDFQVLQKGIRAALLSDANAPVYRSVKLLDIQPNMELNFDVSIFLPGNKKYIKYISAGDEISPEQVEKFKKHRVQSVHVAETQIKSFYQFTAKRLEHLSGNKGGMSETERQERLQSAVREIVTDLFNNTSASATTTSGKEAAENVRGIVKEFILNRTPGPWYEKLSEAMDDKGDAYSRSSKVSNYAALFSIGLEMGSPEDLATAGLLHDLGMQDLPANLQQKDEEEMTKEEFEFYKLHVDFTLRIIRERKLIIPTSVQTAILQHHEKFDGTGFPKGVQGSKFTIEGQILALADRFEGLTSIQAGKKRLTTLEALRKIQNQGVIDPEIMKKAIKILPKDSSD